MNKKVITIGILAIVALIFLTLFTLGSLAGKRGGLAVNPASQQATTEPGVGGAAGSFSMYHNKDVKENFYTIHVPSSWQLQLSSPAGAYRFTFTSGEATVELMDIPDNTTPELLVLSREEPRLKNSLTNYQRIKYQKLTLDGKDAYQLTYQYTRNNKTYQALRTYITGPDRAGVVTFVGEKEAAASSQFLLTSVLNSFHWENP